MKNRKHKFYKWKSYSLARKMKITWQRISYFGVNRSSSIRIQKKIILTNRLCLVLIGIQVSSVFIFYGTPHAYSNTITSAVLIAFISSILLLNKFNHPIISRTILCTTLPIIITASSLITLATAAIVPVENIIAARIVTTGTTALLFALIDFKNEKSSFILALTINVAIILLFDTFCLALGVMDKISGGYQYHSFIITTVHIIIVVFVILVLLHTDYITTQYEKRNLKLITDLKSKNATIHEQSYEIMAQLEEIRAQSEELITQNEQLNYRETKLIEKEHIITNQNEELSTLNEGLEIVINQRTSELNRANHELEKRIQDLDQFAYTLSHNLRAPAASIKGLVNLMDMEDGAKSEIPNMLKHSSDSLLQVMTELQRVLDINSNSNLVFEKINIKELTQVLLEAQKEIIENVAVDISLDFQVETISSVPVYINSILSNLISNAIKFRQPDTTLKLQINTKQVDDNVQITISDNGLGIDTARFENDLFKLYKRFHTHTPGSGAGLYLIKTQLEAMSGTIAVESEVLKGTTFTIVLPIPLG